MELSQFQNFLLHNDQSEKTIAAYSSDLLLFSQWFQQTNAQELSPELITFIDLREYKQYLLVHQKAKSSTINRRFASIRAYIKWAIHESLITQDPTLNLRGVREQELAPRWLSRLEQSSLIREAERKIQSAKSTTRKTEAVRDHTILLLTLNTGMRLSELCNLQMQDVELTDRKGNINIQNGKGQKSRTIPINEVARKSLRQWLQFRPTVSTTALFVGMRGALKPRAIQESLTSLGYKAKIHVTPHMLRHTFAKNLVNSNVSLEKVGTLMAHENLNTTRRYITPSYHDLERAVDQLDG